jgi:SNF2 family DNA or RNA helicase
VSEFEQWAPGRYDVIQGGGRSSRQTANMFSEFAAVSRPSVLITSYDSCRNHGKPLLHVVDVVVCDEAHRLKSARSKTSVFVASITSARKILLTGTPLQNRMSEFFVLLNLAQPQFGTTSSFVPEIIS